MPANAHDFTQPPAVVTRDRSAVVATRDVEMPAAGGGGICRSTEPSVYCEVHGSGFWERVKRSFGFSQVGSKKLV